MERWMNSSLFLVMFMVADEFSRFLTMVMDVFCGNFFMTTHNPKTGNVTPYLKIAPVA